MTPTLRWHVFPEAAGAVAAATRMIEFEAAGAIAVRGRFSIVVTGGSAPRPIYERLARYDTDWSRWHVFFSDERCRPPGHEERNDAMARAAWLDRVPIPRGQVYSIPAELGPDAGAAAYHRQLTGEPPFDLTLLGLGEDGHVASVFPRRAQDEQQAPDHPPDALGVHDSPKPPPERVSLSIARLARSEHVALIVLGAHKREAVKLMREGADVPVNWLRPEVGIDVFADEAAAGPA